MIAKRNKYKDLLVIVLGFSAIGLLLYFKGKPAWTDNGIYVVYAALGLGAIGVFSEKATFWVTKAWEQFGKFLGKISSTIILSALFILMVSPLAIIKRLTTKKELGNENSNWTEADSTTVDFEKLW